MDEQERINELSAKLEALINRHREYTDEIRSLRDELRELKGEPKIERSIKKKQTNYGSQSSSIPPTEKYGSSDGPKRLERDFQNKSIGGVCAGLANYFGISRVLMRLLFIAITFFYGIGILVYVLLWIALPEGRRYFTNASTSQQKPISSVPKQKFETARAAETSTAGTSQGLKTNEGSPKPPRDRSKLERFIGEKIISIVGIAITVVGASIGVKYSIEHELISPVGRIVLGYILGAGLLGVGIYLKKKFPTFSAILLSGAMAIFYFTTFSAYSFYALYPQMLAFMLMVSFTTVTVYLALRFNQQIIAIIGLVGAYAVPFLLSDGSGQIEILLVYTAIINVGILVIAFKRSWKILYYSAFSLTWLIFFSWFKRDYTVDEHFYIAAIFLLLFYLIFYAMFLAHKFIRSEVFEIADVFVLLLNSFIFYGIGYSMLNDHINGENYLGLFTLMNALLHGAISLALFAKKTIERSVFYFVFGLGIVFATIAIPVQFDGQWVTLLWSGEALLLFWIGRTKHNGIYEQLSFPLIALALISLLKLWEQTYFLQPDSALFGVYHWYHFQDTIKLFSNTTFFASVFFILNMGFIARISSKTDFGSTVIWIANNQKALNFLFSAVLIVIPYLAVFLEIAQFFNQNYAASIVYNEDGYRYFNNDILIFKNIWLIIYTVSFLIALSLINQFKKKSKHYAAVALVLNALVILVFLLEGLYGLSELRDSQLHPIPETSFQTSIFHIGIRYICLAFVIGLVLISKKVAHDYFKNLGSSFYNTIGLSLHVFILWVASSELINIMALSGVSGQYKLGLSILWGLYALMLVVLGIWKRKPYLRFGAIGLFSITLIKLFVYDISHLSTLSKTIVFVSLGILLLIVSFLYNKFNKKIAEEDQGG